MLNNLISVIIPVYNHAHTLERCLESIFKQTFLPAEIIIVNDGSTDNFDEVIEKLKIKYKNLKIFSQPNHGAASARNYGWRESTGEYVIFWDADTIAKPEMLAKLSKALAEHPESSYAYCQYKFGWKKIKSQPFNAEDLKKYNYIDTTSLIRRDAIEGKPPLTPPWKGGEAFASSPHQGEVGWGLPPEGQPRAEALATPPSPLLERGGSGPWDESLTRFQDWDLWLTLLEQNKTGVFVPEVLYTKIVQGRKGYSNWLPSFVFKLPFRTKSVEEYEKAKSVVLQKHRIN